MPRVSLSGPGTTMSQSQGLVINVGSQPHPPRSMESDSMAGLGIGI